MLDVNDSAAPAARTMPSLPVARATDEFTQENSVAAQGPRLLLRRPYNGVGWTPAGGRINPMARAAGVSRYCYRPTQTAGQWADESLTRPRWLVGPFSVCLVSFRPWQA